MSREYIFNHYTSRIDIEKENYKPVLESKWKSFLWDKNIKGITLRKEVSCHGDINIEHKTKIRLAIIKDKDCQEFKEAERRYYQWEYTKGEVSSTIKIDEFLYHKILALYSKAVEKASNEFVENIIKKVDLDYSMPIGQWEDTLTLTIPIDINNFEPNTLYRIGIYECGEAPTFCHEWSWFDFFRLEQPIEETFVPYSAYLKVRKQIGGKLHFDKATNYRHYNDYFSNIHFDKRCDEVEVNPTLVCFELEVKCDKKNLPLFKIVMSSGSEVIHCDFCRLFDNGGNRIVAFCSLSVEEIHITNYNEINASLQVFEHTLASFSFLTSKTERGVHLFNI